jgi:uncharacterized protein involved in outer membrane biogenesis
MRYVLAFLGVATLAGLPRDTDSAANASGVPVEFAISAEDFVTPGGRTIQGLPPLLIKATLEGTDTRYTLRDLDMRIGGVEFAGEITVDSSAAIPNVTGSLTSRRVDLAALLPAKPAETGTARDRLFSTAGVRLDVPMAFNARIDLHASEFKLSPLELHDVGAKLTLANGTLSVESLRGQVAGGTIEGSMTVFAPTDPPVVELRARLTGISPEQLPQVAASGTVRGAPTDLSLDLRGRGRSVADVLGSSNGNILVSVGPGEFGEAATGASFFDALFGILGDLNPLSVKQKVTRLQCAVLNFRVQEGVAANPTGVAVQTDSFNILGGGIVDLGSERIDLAGKPKRRSKGVLGLLGVEANVSVGGTLLKPEVTTGASVGAGTVGRVGAAWMTGGLTLIAEGMFDQLKFGDDVCTVARAPAPAR